MKIVELSDVEVKQFEEKLDAHDEKYMKSDNEGSVAIGIENDNGALIGGLDAEITINNIIYVSTVYVDEAFRGMGYGRELMVEMEHRARSLGAKCIRLDTTNWQGHEFYLALGYEQVGHYQLEESDYAEYFFIKRL